MKTVVLKDPYPNGFENKDDARANVYLECLKDVYEALHNGTLYVKYISGDREGSIAKAQPNPRYKQLKEPEIDHHRSFNYRNNIQYRVYNDRFYVLCTWKGRRNKVQENLPHRDIELLIGDDIETIWNKFDAKAAKEEVLKNPQQYDIDGNELAIGDKVMYINISYGSRMLLQRGTVKEFKASVNSSSVSITTVIENSDKVLSELNYPHDMVIKI